MLIKNFIQRLDVERRYPLMLVLDITNVCNFECPHCPQPAMTAQPNYRASYLDYDAYTRIIDEVADRGVKFIRFTGDGETILHKRFLDMVHYAKRKTRILRTTSSDSTISTGAPERRSFKVEWRF